MKPRNHHDEARPSTASAVQDFPAIGDTTQGLGDYLVRVGKLRDSAGYERVRRDALAIVRNCVPFAARDEKRTGLVVGYVQSGKTLSMTAVSALAKDNGCRIVIVLAGVTTNLLQQNASRFKNDLRAASGNATAWRVFNSQDGMGTSDLQHLQQAVDEWRDPSFGELDRQTFLYVVLKNHASLEKLYGLVSKVDLRGIPVLVLDDEADQAGLNTSPDKPEASTTYSKILQLRNALPHHTYLQYTATPQAPLLIALDDMLSPAFAEVVEPGDGYTGGHAFFGVGAANGIVRSIPADDLFSPGTPPAELPESLLEALRVFFVGCAVASIRGKPAPRSMLVHPSQRTKDHGRYLEWIQEAIKRWTSSLRSTEQEERDEVVDEFRPAYDDLSRTDATLPPLADLVQRLQVSLGRVSLTEVNSEGGTEIDWDNANEHILVGGEKLNRGFTVEGLTVTYMPRDAGGWNADTLQQRARFYGYKSGYLSLCRLYLHPEVIQAFRSYVLHEDDIRKQLVEHRGKPLRAWRRSFFLDARMGPTRRNVLSDPYYRIRADRPWFVQERPHVDLDAAARNQASLDTFCAELQFARDESFFNHESCEVLLADFYREVALSFQVREGDVASWYGQLVVLRDILDASPDAPMLLVKMHGERTRSVSGGAIKLHQGRSSSNEAKKYPGDKLMCDPTIVSVQLHTIRIDNNPASTVPAVAIHIPIALRKDDVLSQG